MCSSSDLANNNEIDDFINDEKNKVISLSFGKHYKVEYPYCWLRDNCRCEQCYNATINQKLEHLINFPMDVKPLSVSKQGDGLAITWEDNHLSSYPSQLLYDCNYETWKKSKILRRTLWSGSNVPQDIASVDRDEFLKSEDALKKLLNSLLLFGMAFVDNVKPTLEDTELVIRRVAAPQTTLFGDMWKFTSNLDRADTAYTNIPLAAHTDGTYLVDSPGLQVLHCLEHDGTGGDTIALDGFQVADILQRDYPALFKTLTDTPQPAKYEEKGWYQYHCDPVIKVDNLTRQIQQIRYNVYDRTSSCVSSDPKKVYEMHEALRKFGELCDSEEIKWIFKLSPGRVFLFDNWRILHGRTGFTGRRVLGGSYVSRADWMSAARVRGLIN